MEHNEGGIFQSIRFWQGWAALATVAALFTFIANIEFVVGGHTPDYVAVVGEPGLEPLWVVNADLGEGLLHVRAGAVAKPGEGEAYALWLAGPTQQRLGVLPVERERGAIGLTDVASAILAHGKTVGVRLESSGGEEEEAAGADLLYQTRIVRL